MTAVASTLHHRRFLHALRRGWVLGLAWLLAAGLLAVSPPVRAQSLPATPLILQSLSASRSDDGVVVAFDLQVSLPRAVEDALLKGVPLHFIAEAELLRNRWYWTDRSIARVQRSWRLAWQPLTRNWRVSFGGLHQLYPTLPEALAVMSRSRWKIAEAHAVEDDARYSVVFDWRLDTDQLPRPLQFGLGDADWEIGIQRTVPLGEGPR